MLKNIRKFKYTLCYIFFLILIPKITLATYEFAGNSGLNETAFETGHTDLAVNGINELIAAVIQAVLSLVGVIFLLLMIYGGYLWMTARGNEQQVEKAKKIIIESIIGVAVVLIAYAITAMVIYAIGDNVLQ
ncbi:pilin [bacterium]|nr:pilin [bacterium]